MIYQSDYYYSYYDGLSESSRGNAESLEKLKNSWMFYKKDGYNTLSDGEWILPGGGISLNSMNGTNLTITDNGSIGSDELTGVHSVRPVFFLLSTSFQLKGTGKKSEPYRIILN